MAKEPTPRHLTITIDFDLQTEGSKVQYQRARAAYEVDPLLLTASSVAPGNFQRLRRLQISAIAGGVRAFSMRETLEGYQSSRRAITSEIDWSYRWTRERDVQFRRPDLVDDEIEEIARGGGHPGGSEGAAGRQHPCRS